MSEYTEPAAWRFEIEHMDRWRTTVTLEHPEDVFSDHADVALRNIQPLYATPEGDAPAGRQEREEPVRSESADFGGGETTGVQDL